MEASSTGSNPSKLPRSTKSLLPLLAALNFGGLLLADAGEAPLMQEDGPQLQSAIPSRVRGEKAIVALGKDLPAVARFYHTSEKELADRLRRDKTLWVDPKGRLLYVCEWKAADNAPAGEDPQVLPAAPFPEENTFKLHSRPGASKVIYLDFDGCNASGTSWGSDAIGRAFDTDSNPSSFSSSERTLIQGVWQRVAEDYAMYDIDVTTEEPGIESLRKSNTSDQTYGVRVAVGGSSTDWYGAGAGGVAYVGSFNWNSDTPCWVFPGMLGNSEKNIAEAASHEAGHTLGLSHDGKDVGTSHTEYYGGQGNWAPIMGVGYGEPVTQWSRGEYANANNTEDDLSKMLTYGVAYRADDHGSSTGTATVTEGTSFKYQGNIERSTDVDYFRFQSGPGTVTFRAQPSPNGPNLHIQFSLLDSVGNIIVTVEPSDTSGGVQPAIITRLVQAGTYYLSVQGVGTGDPAATGYSDYASLGEYTLTGSLPSDSAWVATPPGQDYLWTVAANWNNNSYPYGVGAAAKFINNIEGDQTITVDAPQVISGLMIGDGDSQNSFLIQSAENSSLTFDTQSGNAWITKSIGTNDTITSTLVLNSPLAVTNLSDANLELGGMIYGGGGIRKMGPGSLILSGTNASTGDLVVTQGSVILRENTSIASSVIDIGPGAELSAEQVTGGFVLRSGQSLSGAGMVRGIIYLDNGASLIPGSNNVAGSLAITGSLSMAEGSRLSLDLGPSTVTGSGSNDLLVVDGDVNLLGPIAVNFSFPNGMPETSGTYTIATYSGVFAGDGTNLQTTATASRHSFAFDLSVPGEIRVHVSGASTDLAWHGDGIGNIWDMGGNTNWTGQGTAEKFLQFDRVVFDDSGLNTPAISLTALVEPGSVEFNASKDYTITGGGKLSGGMSLLKSGTGNLTLGTANSYTGDTLVTGGKLALANASALGATNAGTYITNGGTLDFNGFDAGAERLFVSGTGGGENGALFNASGLAKTNASRFVTLKADTTIGGVGRWDIRANPTATLAGNHFNLTKTGNNEIWMADAGPSGLGDINILQGTLGFEGSTTLGDTSARVTVYTNGTLAFSENNEGALFKTLMLDGGRLSSQNGYNSFNGPATLIGSNNVVVNTGLAMRGVISGAGSINKSGPGTLMLATANNFLGELRISGGAVEVYNPLALGGIVGQTVIMTGGRLDVRGQNLGAEQINAQGTGLGNAGAIVNTGSQQINALRFVTLSGPTTFGGINRWDIRANPTGSLTGNNFALTKRGPNEVWLGDLGQTGLGTISVLEGLLGVQGTTMLGNPTSTLTISSDATLAISATTTNVLIKNITMDRGRLYNVSGSNVLSGTVTATGSNRVDIAANTKLLLTGSVTGAGQVYKTSSGTLIYGGNNTHSGLLNIVGGTVQVGTGGASGSSGSGSISNSGTLVFFRNNTLAVPSAISGSGSVQIGITDSQNPYMGATILLSGVNTYSGSTTVFGNGNILGVGNDTCLGTGNLFLSGNNNGNSLTGVRSANSAVRTITNNIQLGLGNIFQFGTPGTGDLLFNGPLMTTDNADKILMISNNVTTINSVIGGNSRFIKTGPGTLVLGGNNTNGALVIEMGTVRVDSETRLGRNPAAFYAEQLTLNGGTLQATTSFAIDDINRGISLMNAGGTFQVNPGLTLTLPRSVAGVGSLRKTGQGTLQLSGINTYTGGTTNADGTLVLNGEIQGMPLMVSSGTLTGLGRCLAPAYIGTWGTFSPGLSIGTMTFSNTLHLAGTTIMELSASGGGCDLVRGMTTVTCGGTLRVLNTSGEFSAGQSFKLFDAEAYEGAFQTLELPVLTGTLIWDSTTLAKDGTLRVIEPKAAFASPEFINGALVLSGNGGTAGTEFVLRSSTNAALPIPQWPIVSTNTFDVSGAFRLTNEVEAVAAQKFYLIQTSGW